MEFSLTPSRLRSIQTYIQEAREIQNPKLRKAILAGYLGALQGFEERSLSPNHPNHKEVFQRIREDIQGLFLQLSTTDFSYSTLLSESYNYGVNTVYHLDWKLYMSKELY